MNAHMNPCIIASVAAVIVTLNRRDLLRSVLAGIRDQSRPVNEVIVVDNGSGDGTAAMLREQFPEVLLVQIPTNAGPAGGFARGMEVAVERSHDWVWLLNDDSIPRPTALDACLRTAASLQLDRLGIVMPHVQVGKVVDRGALWRGRARRPRVTGPHPYEVDCVAFSGALVSKNAVIAAGYPRSDYFMMFEENEYCLRLKAAGFSIYMAPVIGVDHLTPLSQGSFSPPWRGYYQTRNHLAMALRRRSPRDLLYWALRQTKVAVVTLLYEDSKAERLWLRALGAWHGLRGRMGRTVNPELAPPKSVRP